MSTSKIPAWNIGDRADRPWQTDHVKINPALTQIPTGYSTANEETKIVDFGESFFLQINPTLRLILFRTSMEPFLSSDLLLAQTFSFFSYHWCLWV